MKKHIVMIVLLTTNIISSNKTVADEFKKVNEQCHQMACESGLYCVELKDGQKKCSTCDQIKLNRYSSEVDTSCKTFREGWTPETSEDYKQALASDGRVLVDVYDKMLSSGKQCKKARTERESECWKGGDPDHIKALDQVSRSIERIAEHKNKMVGEKRVYYGSTSNYLSYLSTFKSKCDLKFPDINQKLDILNNLQNKGEKVSCSDIETASNTCERCYNSSKDLLNFGFSNSSSKFPGEYEETYKKAEGTWKKAQELLSTVKGKNLCN
jgi:hypothetical protein